MENLKIEPTINKFDVRVGKKKDTKYNTDIKITARSEIRMEELYNLAAKGIMKSPNLTMFPITESRTIVTPEKEKRTGCGFRSLLARVVSAVQRRRPGGAPRSRSLRVHFSLDRLGESRGYDNEWRTRGSRILQCKEGGRHELGRVDLCASLLHGPLPASATPESWK